MTSAQRKKTLIIILFALGFSVVIFGIFYLFFWFQKATPYIEKTDNVSQSKDNNDFLNFLEQKKKLSQIKGEVSLIAVGDISYSRGVERTVKKENDINYPFYKIKDYFKSADLIFGNLETPITQGREIAYLEMLFRSNPGTQQALKEAGFSVLSLANNHTMNFGEKGLKDTFDYLDKAGIKYVGAGMNEQQANHPVYIEKKGIKFAFLAYNDADVVPASYEAGNNHAGTAFMRSVQMVEAVKEAKQNSDFVIVSMHSGTEYIGEPNHSQSNFAHAVIDAGADLVIGHHPHVVQTMEKYKGKYIFYSLGNFIFDQMWSQETKDALTAKIYFTKDGITKISFLPVVIENFAQPRMANDSEAKKILQRLKFPYADKVVFSWDKANNEFDSRSRAVIYEKTQSGNSLFTKEEKADLDSNSIPEVYILEGGQLTIKEKSKIIWQSSTDWWIDDFVLADSNNDGISDINLSLWKAGNFGESKPFWVKENDMSVKNHFFVLDFLNGKVKTIWGSSNLEFPNCNFKIVDIDNDGKNELVVIEGDYSSNYECIGNYVAVWRWNRWGFANEWRSADGNFTGLEIERINGKNYIVVDFPS
ncbi:MAG: CapA family protein [bacterium]